MTDIAVLLEGGNAFAPVFGEYGFKCGTIVPQALGSPFCPPLKLLILPSGFPHPRYFKLIPSALNRCAGQIRRFVENGGIILIYGPLMDEYRYDWLPMKLCYRLKPRKALVSIVNPDSPGAVFLVPGEKGCDGYFEEYEGTVVMEDEKGHPVLVCNAIGKGFVIAAGTYHYPEKKFLEWACSAERSRVRL